MCDITCMLAPLSTYSALHSKDADVDADVDEIPLLRTTLRTHAMMDISALEK